MRLIDADALLDKQEALYMKRHILFHGVTAYTIESSPTIDPETLPIVQELRKELERVTAEREALAANSRPAAYGEWEEIRDPYGKIEGWICKCGSESRIKSDFCPYCGADMRGKANE